MLVILAIFALAALWAKTEPLPERSQRTAECSYTEHAADIGHGQTPTGTIVCVERGGEDEGNYSERELASGNLWALVPAFRHWLRRMFSDPVAGFTGLLFVTTVLLWLATERTVLHARDATQRQLRAYVSASPGKVANIGARQIPNVTIVLKNHGQTPARNVTIRSDVQITDNTEDSAFKIIPPRENLPVENDLTLAPSSEINSTVDADFSLTEPAVREYIDGHIAIYAVGFVRYRDIFNHDRITRFRYKIAHGQPGPGFAEVGNGST